MIVFTTDTSAVGVTVIVVVVLELFPGVGSVTPTGGVIVAVLVEIVPVSGAVAVIVYVTEPAFGNVGIVDGFAPGPQTAPPVAPPQANVTPKSSAGTVSENTAPSADEGPALLTTT